MRLLVAFALVFGLAGNIQMAEAAQNTNSKYSKKYSKKSSKKYSKRSKRRSKRYSKRKSRRGYRIAAVKSGQTKSTSSLTSVTKEVKSPWSGSIYTEQYFNQADKSPDVASYTYARANYKLTDNASLAFVQGIEATYGIGTKKVENKDTGLMEDKATEGEVALEDFHIRGYLSNIAQVGDAKVNLQGRVYFPTSKGSRDNGQVTQVRIYADISKSWSNGFSLGYTLNPRLFVQQYTTAADNESGTDRFRFLHFASAGYKFNDKLSINQDLGLYHRFTHGEPALGVNKSMNQVLYAWSYLAYDPADWLSLTGGIQSISMDIRNTDAASSASLYPSSEAFWIMSANISM